MHCNRVAFIAAVLAGGLLTPAHAQEESDALAAQRYAVALGFQKKQLWEQAEARWKSLLQDFPQHEKLANAHYHLAVAHLQQSELHEAEQAFQLVLDQHADFEHRDGAQYNLALVRFNRAAESQKPEDYRKAAETFAEIPKLFADSEYRDDAGYYQAESLYLAGEPDAAIDAYRTAIGSASESPLLPDLHYALGTVLQEQQRPDEAAQTYRTYLEKFNDSPQAPECRLRLGMVELELGNAVEAEQQLAQVAVLPDFPFADFAMLQQAQARFEQDRFEDAAKLYEEIPTRFSESSYILTARLKAGMARFAHEDYANARRNLEPVVNSDTPEATEAAWWLGRTFLALSSPPEALTVLEQALAKYTESEFVPRLSFTRIDALSQIPDRQPEVPRLFAEFAVTYKEIPLAFDALYRSAHSALHQEQYDLTRESSDGFLARDGAAEHPLCPEVLFLGAESALLAEQPDLANARLLYRRLIEQHADHRHAPQSQLRIGFALYLEEQYDQAIQSLSQARPSLTEADAQAEAWFLIGRCHSALDRPQEAVQALQQAEQTKTDWERGDEVLLSLAEARREIEADSEAVASLTRLLDRFKESSFTDRTRYQLGEIALDAQQFDDARRHYAEVIQQHQDGEFAAPALYGSAMAAFAQEQFPAAEQDLSRLLGDYSDSSVAVEARLLRGLTHQRQERFAEAIDDLQACLKEDLSDGNMHSARLSLAVCQAALERFTDAIATLEGLLAEATNFENVDQALFELAYAYREADRPEDAVQSFRRLTDEYTDSPFAAESWFRIGEVYESQADEAQEAEQQMAAWESAEQAYAEGLETSQDPLVRERLCYKLGSAQFLQDKHDAAVTTLLAQVQEFPEGELVIDARQLTGEALYRQQKWNEAIAQFVQVISADSTHQPRALYLAGDAALSMEDWQFGNNTSRMLLQDHTEFPRLANARYGVGLALQQQGKLNDARNVYSEVIEKDPLTEAAAKSHFGLGELAFAEGGSEDAVEHFLETALGYDIKELQALSHFEAGRCFIQLEQPDNAREVQTVVDEHPDHPRAEDAAALISNLDKSNG